MIVVGDGDAAAAYAADVRVPIATGQDFAALWLLRALVLGRPVNPTIDTAAGVKLADWRAFAERLKSCRFGVLFVGPSPAVSRPALEAAHGLATDLNAVTRFYAIGLRPPGNSVGAEQVMTWQTGYPSRGWPTWRLSSVVWPRVLGKARLVARRS